MTQKDIDLTVREVWDINPKNEFLEFDFVTENRDNYVILQVFKNNLFITSLFCESELHANIVKSNIISILAFDRFSQAEIERG